MSSPLKTPEEKEGPSMKVWIDQDLCTGDGLCEEICPDVFTLLDAVIESAEECPGECIFIEAG